MDETEVLEWNADEEGHQPERTLDLPRYRLMVGAV
jgi:hypothetical protein